MLVRKTKKVVIYRNNGTISVGEKMKVAKPKCPECGGNEFAWKFIPSAEKLERETETRIGRFKFPTQFAIGFCVKCGYIIGMAGM